MLQPQISVNLKGDFLLSFVVSAALHIGLIVLIYKVTMWSFKPPTPMVIDVTIEAEPPLPDAPLHDELPAKSNEVQSLNKSIEHQAHDSSIKPVAKRNVPKESRELQAPGKTEGVAKNSAEVTGTAPQYQSNPKPPYPESARRARKEGTVMLAVTVNADGTVSHAEVSESSGIESLDGSALETVRKWRFKAATLDGEPISSIVTIPIKFQLSQ